MAKSDFSKMCEPAKLYLLVSVIALVYGIFQRFSMITLGTNFIFAVLWTMVLNWLCSIGMKTLSWILVLLPYLMLFLSAGFVVDMMHSKEGFQRVNAGSQSTVKTVVKTTDTPAGTTTGTTTGTTDGPILVFDPKIHLFVPKTGYVTPSDVNDIAIRSNKHVANTELYSKGKNWSKIDKINYCQSLSNFGNPAQGIDCRTYNFTDESIPKK